MENKTMRTRKQIVADIDQSISLGCPGYAADNNSLLIMELLFDIRALLMKKEAKK